MDKLDRSPEIQAELERLDRFMDEALTSQVNPDTCKLLFLISRWLRQFNLNSQIDSSEILVEGYMRTRNKIQKGLVIQNFSAWFKSVSYKIIQEHSKKESNKHLLEQRLVHSGDHLEPYIPEMSDAYNPKVKALLMALEELSEEELEILNLRIVQGLSWKDVRNNWEQITGRETAVSTLRKKGERALKHLRAAFISTSQDSSQEGM